MNALTLNTSNRSEIQYFVDDKQLKISLFFYGDDLPLSENDDNINDQSFIIFVPKKKSVQVMRMKEFLKPFIPILISVGEARTSSEKENCGSY